MYVHFLLAVPPATIVGRERAFFFFLKASDSLFGGSKSWSRTFKRTYTTCLSTWSRWGVAWESQWHSKLHFIFLKNFPRNFATSSFSCVSWSPGWRHRWYFSFVVGLLLNWNDSMSGCNSVGKRSVSRSCRYNPRTSTGISFTTVLTKQKEKITIVFR